MDSIKKNAILQIDSKLNNINKNQLDLNIQNKNEDIEMKSEKKNLNDSLNESKINEKMNLSNELEQKSKISNDTDISYGDNYSTNNSNIIEKEKNKQKENINIEKNECSICKENKEINELILFNKNDWGIKESSNISIQKEEEYIDDILQNLLEEEKNMKCAINPNYFYFQKEINQKMRNILIDWIIDVHYNFNLKEETLYTTIYIIDSYLSKKVIQRKTFQLLGVTSLLIASKLNDVYFRKIEDYVFITNYSYSIDEIKLMEEDIAKTLNFNFLVPTSLSFFEIISKKIGIFEDINKYHFGEFLIQSFLIDFKSLFYSYSTISCASCYIVMKFYKMKNYKLCCNKNFFNDKDNYNENTDSTVIKECAKVIYGVISEMVNLNLKSTIRKYSKDKFYNIINNILEESRK